MVVSGPSYWAALRRAKRLFMVSCRYVFSDRVIPLPYCSYLFWPCESEAQRRAEWISRKTAQEVRSEGF